jgi:hypothetical protein
MKSVDDLVKRFVFGQAKKAAILIRIWQMINLVSGQAMRPAIVVIFTVMEPILRWLGLQYPMRWSEFHQYINNL